MMDLIPSFPIIGRRFREQSIEHTKPELTNNFRQFSCQLLSGKSNQVCSRDHGDVIQDEAPHVQVWPSVMDGNCRRNERPKSIDHHRHMTCGAETDPQKMPRVYPGSSTFTIWLDAPCNLVPIVVEDWHMHVVGGLVLLCLGGVSHLDILYLDASCRLVGSLEHFAAVKMAM